MTPERWARVQEVFAAALEKEPSARRSFVSQASGVDEELRGEVESLLAAHEHASSEFLESPVAGAVPSAMAPRKNLSRGTRLGAFEIVEPLGAGGMGEVYRAKDTKLGREVALKVLPAEVSADPERVKRFEKEARSASALNHPNIVTIHDTGTSDGVSWIAMELVEGQTLRGLVAAGALPAKKLLGIATQIAEGLATAHDVGIVHRDLKPENVMMTKAGLVKILDFGLAKLTGPVSGSGEHSNLPTVTGTSPGIILGTVGYMSPEQASGKAVDYRSDQFAFGSILYEMATGRKAFQKKTAIDTLSAILNQEPEAIGTVNPQTPAPLRWIAERCLAKEPEDRYVATRDLARELGSVQKNLSQAMSGAVLPERPATARSRRILAVAVLGVALIAAGVVGQRWLSGNPKVRIPSFRQITFGRGSILRARFAPDGKTVVYAASWDGAPAELFTVRTDTNPSRPIGLKNADIMSVSSKSELAVLLKNSNLTLPMGTGTLARLPFAGGTPRELLENVVQADWAPNGEDLAVIHRLEGGNHRLEYPIGTPLVDSAGMGAGPEFGPWTRVSPNGKLVAYSEGPNLLIVDRAGKKTIVSPNRGGQLAWSPRGDEIIVITSPGASQNVIYAISLSGRERVLVSNSLPFTLHDVSTDGTLLLEYFYPRVAIACLSRNESKERELAGPRAPRIYEISADGSALIFVDEGDTAIYLARCDGTPTIRVGEGSPQGVSPDGRWVLSFQPGPPPRLVMIPTGPGSIRTIPLAGVEPKGAAWLLPNGKGFVVEVPPDQNGDAVIAVVGPEGGKPRIIDTTGLIHDTNLMISPEGDRIAYVTKDRHLRISPLSGGPTTPVSGDALDENKFPLVWSDDGKFIYFTKGLTGQIDRLELSTGKVTPWKTLLPPDPTGVTGISPVLTPDGRSYAYMYVRSLVSDLYVGEGILP